MEDRVSNALAHWLRAVMVSGLLCLAVGTAHGLPALQLDPGGAGDWSYDNATQTWIVTSPNAFSIDAFANADGSIFGSGSYAWDPEGSDTQHA